MCLASANPGKARELERLLRGWDVEALAVTGYPPEDGATYYENALAKARFGREVGPADAWVAGEDSGIEVEALDGGPGVHSARSAAGDEAAWLLRQLEGVEGEGRLARYVSELVAISPEGREFRGRGTLAGRIGESPSGSGGFGFDPVFIPAGEERTVAELGDGWKAEHSHRANAARSFLEALPA